ncbi:MAG TPA: UPF0182 family protein, partial [Gemmatimonadales bacterium]|nr:UPF0182 family protein [Gemmatimonadales bacterium]
FTVHCSLFTFYRPRRPVNMSRRGRRLTGILATVVLLLFAGRWTAVLLADRWWAAEFSPEAAAYLTDWHILRLTLDLAGIVIASAWFIGHLLLVYRAVGTVQVRRSVANLEFREALTPATLLTVAIATGALLGLLVGVGASGWWREAALAWQGVNFRVADPLMGRDLGVYVAQLPIWQAAHGFILLLVLLGLTGVAALYMLVGAIRWIERRPAINTHARVHLGWLLSGLALVLAWGYLLQRYEIIADSLNLADETNWRTGLFVSPLLAGFALATATLSALWAVRGRHSLVIAGWIVLAGAALVGQWLLPAILGGSFARAVEPGTIEKLDRMAYGLESLRETRLESAEQPAPPPVPSLWNPALVARTQAGDSAHLVTVDPAVLTRQGKRRPAWLVVRSDPGQRLTVWAIADARVSRTGEPLYYRLSDTLLHQTPTSLLDLSPDLLQPEAPDFRMHQDNAPGVEVDSWARRLVLAWALQAGELLGRVPPRTRIDWRLSPEERLGRLAPYAEWSAPVARIINGQLIWVLDGYLASSTFPLTGRVTWRDRRVGSLRAAFIGTVNAVSGATRVYLQAGADPLAETWARLSGGVVEPGSAIPEPVLRAAPYPGELFRIQAQELERPPWSAGSLGARPSPAESPVPQIGWTSDSSSPQLVSTFESPGERRLRSVLIGSRDDGRMHLRLVRLDSTATLPISGVLENRWSMFPSYDALTDSISEDGGKLVSGPVRVDVGAGGPVAYQAHFALRPTGGLVLAWVNVAARDRLGAGRTLAEAWGNLLGTTVPAPPGSPPSGRLEEAKRWMELADSALRLGDWSEFGRAWNTLRSVLGLPPDSIKF